MTFTSFVKLVELPTKVASVFPFLIGTTYAYYRYEAFNLTNFFIMLIAMLCLDLATTALNNYMDYKLAVKTHGFNYEQHNAIVKYEIKESTVKTLIGFLLVTTIVLGLYLFLRTDIVVLLLGIISFFFAVIYTWGPFPISRTPFGEAVSGILMGGVITFISLYVHIFQLGFIGMAIEKGFFVLEINIIEIVAVVVLTMPLITGIANIMLANNTCDMEDDFENRRFTLPLVIGKDNALKLFVILYSIGYIAIVIGSLTGWLPVSCMAVLLTIIPVRKNIVLFLKKQTKKDTFIISVQNFVAISASYFITLAIGILIK